MQQTSALPVSVLVAALLVGKTASQSLWQISSSIYYQPSCPPGQEWDIAELGCYPCGLNQENKNGLFFFTQARLRGQCACLAGYRVQGTGILVVDEGTICTACPVNQVGGICVNASTATTTTAAGITSSAAFVMSYYVSSRAGLTDYVRYIIQHSHEKNAQDIIAPDGTTTQVAGLTSDAFVRLFAKAATKCQTGWDEESCQVLGNLCVLQLYLQTSIACQFYQSLVASRVPSMFPSPFQRPRDMPWLYYQEKPTTLITQFTPNITIDLTSTMNNSALNFYLATYALNGTFLGYQPLQNQLQFCSSGWTDVAPWQKIGHDYSLECEITLQTLINTTAQTVFFDICTFCPSDVLQTLTTSAAVLVDNTGAYVPVPVRILNNLGNTLDTQKAADGDFTGSTFTRRFFLLDNVSGVSNGVLKVIRVVSQVLDIAYSSREIGIAQTPKTTHQYNYPKIDLTVTYTMSMDSFWRTMQILFSLATILAILFSLYVARNTNKRNMTGPGDSIDMKFLVHSFVIMCGKTGEMFFWYMFFVSCYWMLFFKGQSALYLFLPASSFDIYNFYCVLTTATVTQGFYIVINIYYQCTVDVFFIDWEKSRGKLLNSSNEVSPRSAPVSVWRSIFCVNQWNSLQTYRRVHIGFQTIWVYFILDGMQIRNVATMQPNIHDLTSGPRSPILLFAINSCIWLLVVVAQLTFRYAIYDRFYRDKLLQYSDLLSVANVSLIIFDERCHGYYVHGRSVHHMADTDVAELNANLRKEENDMVPGRGLQDTEQQSFEMFVTGEFRATFDKIYGVIIKGHTEKISGRMKQIHKKISRPRGVDETAVKAYETINKFFCAFFDKNLKDFQYSTRPKTYFEKFIGATPDSHITSAFLYDGLGYANVLLRGIELPILIWYALLLSIIDYATGSCAIASMVVFLIDIILCGARAHFGKTKSEDEQANLEKLKAKKAWDVALGPGKSIPMNAFMLYMSGNSVQIFSILITVMLFFNAAKALAATRQGK
ncbi:Meckelin [Irineochytrium annulatum]|nr:Meckelin [Irineochytrium annulatum]